LDSHNVQSEASWHAYLARVYHQPIGNRTVDLNEFTWFYHFSPLKEMIDNDPCLKLCEAGLKTQTHDGTPFIAGGKGADASFKDIGFFVRRPFLSPVAMKARSKLEVQHVMTGEEAGVSWFFVVAGSGIFVDATHLPTGGDVGVFKDRKDWMDKHGGRWWGGDKSVAQLLDGGNLAMMVFTEAALTIWSQVSNGENPRAELVIRHAAKGVSREDQTNRGPCLDHSSIRLRLFTGIAGTLDCVCAYDAKAKSEHVFTNCADTPV
jgi:hypothetical protein